MAWHLHGAIVTANGVAANNRGENEGNLTTLQKILWKGSVHTTVSAEAIRWAIRYRWQELGETDEALETNRCWDNDKEDNTWRDPAWQGWPDGSKRTYIDDDVLGFMKAEGAKTDGSDQANEGGEENKGRKKKTRKKVKGTIDKRRGVLELSRAMSLSPFAGDITFNAKSGEKGRTSLYGTEVHATRFQYGFSMTPSRLHDRSRLLPTLEAIASLGEVAGNHSRFLFDFSPESIVLRWTHDPAPRLLYCFDEGAEPPTVHELLRKVLSRDIDPKELFIGGALSGEEEGRALKAEGVTVESGVRALVGKISESINEELEKGT